MNRQKYWTNSIKEAGQKLVEQAETICKSMDGVSDITIWVNCTPDEAVTMDITKTYVMSGEKHKENGIYVYENHSGGLYTSTRPIPYESRYCSACGDTDYEIGCFTSALDFLTTFVNDIKCNEADGYDIDYIYSHVLGLFADAPDKEEVADVVKSLRAVYGC